MRPSQSGAPVINQAGIRLIEEYESYREFAYPDPASDLARATRGMRLRWGFRPANEILAGLPPEIAQLSGSPWTCGIGTTHGVTPDTRMSRSDAAARLIFELKDFERGVRDACTRQPNENQLAAMTSLAYNIGLGWKGATRPKGAKDGFRQSTVLRAHNRGDDQAASRAFGLWNKANGREEPGLTRRRAAEGALYLKPVVAPVMIGDDYEVPEVEVPDMPQSVDAERPMTESSINRAGVVAGGTAAVASVSEVARTVSDVKWSLQSLGDWLLPALLVISVCAVGYIVWERVNQRKGGWA